jgi:ankyrin repeat protein
MIKDLLLAGADHTIADNAGQTPLQIAHQIGRDPSITLLQVMPSFTVPSHH